MKSPVSKTRAPCSFAQWIPNGGISTKWPTVLIVIPKRGSSLIMRDKSHACKQQLHCSPVSAVVPAPINSSSFPQERNRICSHNTLGLPLLQRTDGRQRFQWFQRKKTHSYATINGWFASVWSGCSICGNLPREYNMRTLRWLIYLEMSSVSVWVNNLWHITLS